MGPGVPRKSKAIPHIDVVLFVHILREYLILDIQGHLLRFGMTGPKKHTIQTPNLRRSRVSTLVIFFQCWRERNP